MSQQLGLLTLAACALVGWWISIRPGASFRSISNGVSCLIILMAVLMLVLVMDGQLQPRGAWASVRP